MAAFVDRVTLHITGGNGGHGCVSVHREKFKPLGGPDGSNGGNGGSIILRADEQATTLLSFHHAPHQRASNGEPGKGDYRHGKNGGDLILPVPVGTIVKDLEGNIVADMVTLGQEYVAAQGGLGGLGNAALASPKRKAPGFALLGVPGEENNVVLELKTVADVALVGYPSAGKSSLIAALSSARPKIADYPFTTLTPHLGVVAAGDTRFTVADVPGLIEGAADGKGLGLEFLRHVERCAALVHVLDTAALETDRDPIADLEVIEAELDKYLVDAGFAGADGQALPLNERPRLIALNKIDVPDGRDMAEFVRPALEERGYRVFEVSAASHEGLKALTFAMAGLVNEARAKIAAPVIDPEVNVLRPKSTVKAQEFTIKREERHNEPLFRVRGEKPERWIVQTDFRNDEAVGYLAERLNKIGIEDELYAQGAKPGDAVVIGGDGGVIFDWEPTVSAGAELLGNRGEDLRLHETARRTTQERRESLQDRKDRRANTQDDLEAERRSGMWNVANEENDGTAVETDSGL